MIKLIHRITGNEMWVQESDLEKFLKRGHKTVPSPKKKRTTKKTR